MQEKSSKTHQTQYRIPRTPVDIRFPYEPTAQQQQILKIILQTIKSGKNCLIESATGTGKTLCLLTSCLTAVKQGLASRVYYLTRTHSQMECILKQLNESGYDSTFAMVQSKKGLCANQWVQMLGKNCSFEQFQNLCSKAKDKNGPEPHCKLSLSITQKKGKDDSENQEPKFSKIYNYGPRTSINQIKTLAEKQGYCPSALESYFSRNADLVIMSYKYLCDSMLFSRKKLADQLSNSIVIFDQAHNIIQTAKDQSGIELSPFMAEKALQNIAFVRKQMQSKITSGESPKQFQKIFLCLEQLQKYANSMGEMNKYFEELYEKQIKKNRYGSRFVLIDMEKVYSEFLKSCIFKNYIYFFKIHMNEILEFSKLDPINESGSVKSKKKNYIVVFSKFCYMLSGLIDSGEMMKNYLCVLQKHLYSSKKKSGDIRVKVNFVCLSSKYTFQRLRRCGARSIIFASGTLNHADFEETELEFLNYFQKSSNFQKGNVSTFLINSHNNAPLQILSDVRKSQEREVVEILSVLIPQIPFGVLVFFKSYDHLQKIRKYMIDHNADVGKTIFWECRKKYEFEMSMKRYVATAQTRQGAVLMAVCRGKVSEGYNFKDNLARAVFIVGYPLMSFDCIPYKIKEYTYKNAAKLSKWYYDDAMNAIKQAMGRGIRHPKDFACIYLIGQKMFEKRRSLPNWVSEDKVFEGCSLSEAMKETRKFMVQKETRRAFDCEFVPLSQIQERIHQDVSESEEEEQVHTKYSGYYRFDDNKNISEQIGNSRLIFNKIYQNNREIVPAFSRKDAPIPIKNTKTDSDEEDQSLLVQMLEKHKADQKKIDENKIKVSGKKPIDEQFNPDSDVIKKPRLQ